MAQGFAYQAISFHAAKIRKKNESGTPDGFIGDKL
jgi:hypothetical protein